MNDLKTILNAINFIFAKKKDVEKLKSDGGIGYSEVGTGSEEVVHKIDDKYLPDLNYMNKTNPIGTGSFSLNRLENSTIGDYSFAEGYHTTANGNYSHAEGQSTVASGLESHAEGYYTTASGNYSHAEGADTTASGNFSHAEGDDTTASGLESHAEGYHTTASGNYSHAEGTNTFASGLESHAEGSSTNASGNESHAEGRYTRTGNTTQSPYTTTINNTTYTNSHAEGFATLAKTIASHAEGYRTQATGGASHAEGGATIASGSYSHAEGFSSKASGSYSHAEGASIANGIASHAESGATANGIASHAEGNSQASSDRQHTQGKFNVLDSSDIYADIIGNGTDTSNRKNIEATTWTGDKRLKGDVYIQCNDDSTGGTKVGTYTKPNTGIPKTDLASDVQTTLDSVSSLQQAIDNKVSVETGKGLSTNDYTTAEKTKLAGIAAGAEVNVNADWNATSGDAQILNKPTALSSFTNDEGFIDNTVSNLTNYYTKTNTYTQSEVNTLIGNLATIQISVVDSLPATGSSNIIYLIPKSGGSGLNVKDEYLWTGSAFEKIGDTEIDLSAYLTKTGDGKDVTVTFTIASTRTNIATGETLSVIMGKLAKAFADLSTAAFTGNYNDLSNKPVIDSALSSSSTNAVQNSVIKSALDQKAAASDIPQVLRLI